MPSAPAPPFAGHVGSRTTHFSSPSETSNYLCVTFSLFLTRQWRRTNEMSKTYCSTMHGLQLSTPLPDGGRRLIQAVDWQISTGVPEKKSCTTVQAGGWSCVDRKKKKVEGGPRHRSDNLRTPLLVHVTRRCGHVKPAKRRHDVIMVIQLTLVNVTDEVDAHRLTRKTEHQPALQHAKARAELLGSLPEQVSFLSIIFRQSNGSTEEAKQTTRQLNPTTTITWSHIEVSRVVINTIFTDCFFDGLTDVGVSI